MLIKIYFFFALVFKRIHVLADFKIHTCLWLISCESIEILYQNIYGTGKYLLLLVVVVVLYLALPRVHFTCYLSLNWKTIA